MSTHAVHIQLCIYIRICHIAKRMPAKYLPHTRSILNKRWRACVLLHYTCLHSMDHHAISLNLFAAPEYKSLKCIGENRHPVYGISESVYLRLFTYAHIQLRPAARP